MRSTEPVCPECKTPVGDVCPQCSRSIFRLRGIVDLRATDDPYLSREADGRLASLLDSEFGELDFDHLLERYLELAEVPPALRPGQIAHIKGAGGRARHWLSYLPETGPILDLGCGSGSFAASVGTEREVIGCDIAMRWLLVARKRLDEIGLSQAQLVCGSAEKLPWADETFAGIVAGDTIEHVSDQAATIAEAFRVLKPGGVLAMATPNRFSLGPEPHVGLLGVGYLPRRLMGPYVQWRGRGDFRAIRTHGLGSWRALLDQSPFQGGNILAPSIPEDDLRLMPQPKQWAARRYNAFSQSRLALRVGPLFHLVCRKPRSCL